jgi:hypothetical protein
MWGLMFSGALCFSDRPFFLASRFYVPLLGGFLKPTALQVVADFYTELLNYGNTELPIKMRHRERT